jgi:hypothetical protein
MIEIRGLPLNANRAIRAEGAWLECRFFNNSLLAPIEPHAAGHIAKSWTPTRTASGPTSPSVRPDPARRPLRGSWRTVSTAEYIGSRDARGGGAEAMASMIQFDRRVLVSPLPIHRKTPGLDRDPTHFPGVLGQTHAFPARR